VGRPVNCDVSKAADEIARIEALDPVGAPERSQTLTVS
jgi:hypothetical protein